MKLSKTITEYSPFSGSRVFIAPTHAKDVVTIVGSVLGGENMLPREIEEAAGIAAELFDTGTKNKSKEEIRGSLASRGAYMSFSAGADRLHFSGSCLPEDLPFLLKLIADCLTNSVFPVSEIKTIKKRLNGDLIEEKTDTRTQASAALTRLLYDKKHVNYSLPTSTRIDEVQKITRKDLLAYKSLIGIGGLVLCIAGDVKVPEVMKMVTTSFKTLDKGTNKPSIKTLNTKKPELIEQKIQIADKTNIDVYMGATIPITYDSKDYLPFIMLTDMLGGRGFTNHLMQTLRERDSLTYVAYAYPAGFQQGTEGYFRIWAAFSPSIYDKAVVALKKEVNFFFTKGITEQSMQIHKDRMIGTSLIGLSSTKGLAQALHGIAIEDRPLSYIDEYPELLKAVTLDDLKRVAALIPLDKLSLAAAGTFVK